MSSISSIHSVETCGSNLRIPVPCFCGNWKLMLRDLLQNEINYHCKKGICMICTHVKSRKLFQICKPVVTRLWWSRYQDVSPLLVPSCCDKSGTSWYHLVTRLMTVTDLLQVVPTRLIQAVRNKLLRACCHQLVNNLLRADDIRLVGTTCCESVTVINLVTRW
jgi:hypothetical protein